MNFNQKSYYFEDLENLMSTGLPSEGIMDNIFYGKYAFFSNPLVFSLNFSQVGGKIQFLS